MSNFKQKAEEWAEEMLAKSPKIPYDETARKLEEFMILGSLLYDDKGNWIPRLERNQIFEIKPAKIKNGKII
jgi:hypothetical protein